MDTFPCQIRRKPLGISIEMKQMFFSMADIVPGLLEYEIYLTVQVKYLLFYCLQYMTTWQYT